MRQKIERGKQLARKFIRDESAQTNMARLAVGVIVSLTVGGLVAAFLIPIAIDEIVAVGTSSWSDGASSIWGILDVIIVLSLFLYFVSMAMKASENV